jgi:hypothetical protein
MGHRSKEPHQQVGVFIRGGGTAEGDQLAAKWCPTYVIGVHAHHRCTPVCTPQLTRIAEEVCGRTVVEPYGKPIDHV